MFLTYLKRLEKKMLDRQNCNKISIDKFHILSMFAQLFALKPEENKTGLCWKHLSEASTLHLSRPMIYYKFERFNHIYFQSCQILKCKIKFPLQLPITWGLFTSSRQAWSIGLGHSAEVFFALSSHGNS